MQAVVGGIVKAFKIDYIDNATNLAEGSFWFDLGDDKNVKHDATFRLLGHHWGEICCNVVEKTSQLQHEAVLEVYFSAYCQKINMWVIAYESFKSRLLDTINNEPTQLNDFFQDSFRLELTEFWRNTLRCVKIDRLPLPLYIC